MQERISCEERKKERTVGDAQERKELELDFTIIFEAFHLIICAIGESQHCSINAILAVLRPRGFGAAALRARVLLALVGHFGGIQGALLPRAR